MKCPASGQPRDGWMSFYKATITCVECGKQVKVIPHDGAWGYVVEPHEDDDPGPSDGELGRIADRVGIPTWQQA